MKYFFEDHFNGYEVTEDSYKEFVERELLQPMIMPCTKDFRAIPARRIFWRGFYCCDRTICPWNKKGIYMYGDGHKVMYIGMTGKTEETLQKRLQIRYFKGEYTAPRKGKDTKTIQQFIMASIIHKDGINEFQNQYDKCFHNKRMQLRIRHAKQFAMTGMGGVWFALLPCMTKDYLMIKELEKALIIEAQLYNKERGISYDMKKGEQWYLLNSKIG